MSIPLDKLIDKDVNVYEMTCVAIKEAAIMASKEVLTEEQPEEQKKPKVVSEVLAKVLNDQIEYAPVEK